MWVTSVYMVTMLYIENNKRANKVALASNGTKWEIL